MVRSSRLVLPAPGELTRLKTKSPACGSASRLRRGHRVVLLEHLAFDGDDAHRATAPSPASTTRAAPGNSSSTSTDATCSSCPDTIRTRASAAGGAPAPGSSVAKTVAAGLAARPGRHALDGQPGMPPRRARHDRAEAELQRFGHDARHVADAHAHVAHEPGLRCRARAGARGRESPARCRVHAWTTASLAGQCLAHGVAHGWQGRRNPGDSVSSIDRISAIDTVTSVMSGSGPRSAPPRRGRAGRCRAR